MFVCGSRRRTLSSLPRRAGCIIVVEQVDCCQSYSSNGRASRSMREVQGSIHCFSTVCSCYRDKISWHQHFPNVRFAARLRNRLTLSNIFVYKAFTRYVLTSSVTCFTTALRGHSSVWPPIVSPAVASHYRYVLCRFHCCTTEKKETTEIPLSCGLGKRAVVTLKTALPSLKCGTNARA